MAMTISAPAVSVDDLDRVMAPAGRYVISPCPAASPSTITGGEVY